MDTLVSIIKNVLYGIVAAIIVGLVAALFVFGSVVMLIMTIALAVILIAYAIREMLEPDDNTGG